MQNRIPVTFFHRKPSPTSYSIEFIFSDVRCRLQSLIDAKVCVAEKESRGLSNRVRIMLQASRHQSVVNHVTGDINFIGLALNRRKTIQTIHDCGNIAINRGIKRWILQTIWLNIPVRRARFVTTVSNDSKENIVRLTKCDPQKVKVIYNPISEVYQAKPFQFNSLCPRILQVGGSANKNIPRLAQAIAGLNCKLIIVGRMVDSAREALRKHSIDFENRTDLSQEEVLLEYTLADVVAFASLNEGFGMPIVEANAVGRPVVTGNVTAMPEIAGNAACLVDPLDVSSIREGFLRIFSDENYRNQLVDRGFENAKRFHPDSIAQAYLALYKQVEAEQITRDAVSVSNRRTF